MPNQVSRFPNGVSTSVPTALFNQYPWPGPVDLAEYKNDFFTYAAGDWTVTSTNSGTTALTAGDGGLLIQTTGGTSTNYQANQLATTSFYMTTGNRHWFWINFNLSDTAHTLFAAGLVDTLAGGTKNTPAKGIWFNKTDASTSLTLKIAESATTTITVGTIAAATNYTVGWYYDGKPNPTLYIYSSIGLTAPTLYEHSIQYNGGAWVAAAGALAPAGSADLTNIPLATTALTLGFGITTGASAAHTNTVDYVGAASQISARF
jgi:hypothetical protein